MAYMRVIELPKCGTPGCEAKATRTVCKNDGADAGDYCARHGNTRLVELAKEEGLRDSRQTEQIKAVKS